MNFILISEKFYFIFYVLSYIAGVPSIQQNLKITWTIKPTMQSANISLHNWLFCSEEHFSVSRKLLCTCIFITLINILLEYGRCDRRKTSQSWVSFLNKLSCYRCSFETSYINIRLISSRIMPCPCIKAKLRLILSYLCALLSPIIMKFLKVSGSFLYKHKRMGESAHNAIFLTIIS